MQENSKDTLDAKISELEEKLIYSEKQYEQAKDLIRSEKVNFQENPKRWQDNLDFMQKERQDIENQLVALLLAHPAKVEPSTPEGEEQLSFDIFTSIGDEESRIRQKIPARLKARQAREAGILEGVLGEARQVLGDGEALRQIVLAVQADDSYSDQAGNALLELRRLGDKRVLEPLVGLLKVKGAPGYWSAMALARLFTLEEVLPVHSGRLDATDPVVRLNTVVAFGYLGKTFRFPDPKTAFEFNGFVVTGEPIDDRIFNLLMPMLDDHDDDVRAKTVVELCSLGDKRAIPKLVLALEDPAPTVRQCAAAFLGGLGDERAIEPLLRAARSGDKEVESRAGQSLRLLGYEGEGIENPWKRLAEAIGDITAGLAMAFGNTDELEKAEDEAGIEGSLGYHLRRAREENGSRRR